MNKNIAKSTKIKNGIKFILPDWKEAKNNLWISVVIFIFSPFSILLGFYLNDYLARPIFSIEYVFPNRVFALSNLENVENHYKESQNYIEYFGQAHFNRLIDLRSITNSNEDNAERLLYKIHDEVRNFSKYLDRRKTELQSNADKLESASPSKLVEWSLYYLNNADIMSDNKKELRSIFSDLHNKIVSEQQYIQDINKSLTLKLKSLQFKLSILNKGSTDGLIRNMGYISFAGQIDTLYRSEAPRQENIFNAVPTFSVNNETYSNSAVGKVEKKSMLEFWYRIDINDSLVKTLEQYSNQNYRITLEDQDRKKIDKEEPINKILK